MTDSKDAHVCSSTRSLKERKHQNTHVIRRSLSLFQQGQGPSILEVAQFCIPQFACTRVLRSPEVLPPEWLVPWPFRKMFRGELLPLHVCSGVVPPCNERVFEQKWAGLEPVHAAKERASKMMRPTNHDNRASRVQRWVGEGGRDRQSLAGNGPLYTLDIQ